MKTKVYLSLLFCVLFAFALTFTVSATSEKAITYTMEPSGSIVQAGETFTVDILIPENTGFVWTQVGVNYNAAQVTPVMEESYSSEAFGVSSKDLTLTVKHRANVSDILVTVGAQTSSLIPSSGVIYNQTGKVVTLTFKVVEGYEGPVDLTLTAKQNNVFTQDGLKDFTITVNNPTFKAVDCSKGHTPGAEATCTTDQVCLKCETVLVKAFGHTEGTPVIENNVDPTCTTEGSYDTVVYCSVCKVELSRVHTVVPALGHSAGEAVIENEVDPTCTTEGSYDTVVYCTVCKVELSRVTTVVPALGHTEGEAVIENKVEPNCTDAGSYDTVIYCTVCNVELSRVTTVVDALGHTWNKTAGTPATCAQEGTKELWVCNVCGVTDTENDGSVIPTLPHELGDYVNDDANGHWLECANCDYTEGYAEHTFKNGVCSVCGYGCTHKGGTASCSAKATCTICGKKYGNKLPHTPGAEATCTEDQVCTVCNNVISKATGHTYVDHEAKEATCTEAGHNAYQTCEKCDYTSFEEIAATGHTYVDHEAKAPTCNEAGWDAYQTCENCDFTSYAEIAATGEHVYDNGCDADCNVCGATRTADGHKYGDWVVVKEATTEAAGEKERTCSECGHVEKQAIDKLTADNTGDNNGNNNQNNDNTDKAGFPWWIILIVAAVAIVVIVVVSRKKGKK